MSSPSCGSLKWKFWFSVWRLPCPEGGPGCWEASSLPVFTGENQDWQRRLLCRSIPAADVLLSCCQSDRAECWLVCTKVGKVVVVETVVACAHPEEGHRFWTWQQTVGAGSAVVLMMLKPFAVLPCFDDGLVFFEGYWPVKKVSLNLNFDGGFSFLLNWT